MTQPRLLLVDDSAEVALIVRHICGRAGMEIVSHPDAEQAWTYLQTNRPDLVLLDVHLPAASGFELCRWVRAAPALADLPIALLSHWRQSEDIAIGLLAGTDFVLSKDLLGQPEEWKRRLGDILVSLAGRRPGLSLPWKDAPPDARTLAEHLDALAFGPVARKLGDSVTRLLLLRAMKRTGAPQEWLTAEPLRLDVARMANEAAVEKMQGLLAAFADELWCLLGTAEIGPLLESLPIPKPLSCSPLP